MLKRAIPKAAAMAAALMLALSASASATTHRHHHHHASAHRTDYHHYGGDPNGNYCNHGNYGHEDNHGDNHGQNSDHGCSYGTYSAWDEEWLKTSLEGDLFEIAGGKLAQTHSTNATVKALGAKLQSDHTKSFQDGAEVAKKLGIEVPSEPTPSEQWELQAVSYLSGSNFDRAYTSLEVADHKQDIEETKAEIEKGCNPLIRHEAQEDLPVLEEHLKLSEKAQASS